MNLEEIHARYGRWIRKQVRRHLPDTWEDGVQEVLVKLQSALARQRGDHPAALHVLVSRTVRSVCIDELRRRARSPLVPAGSESLDPQDPTGTEHGEAGERAELLVRVRTAWEALPERDRRILELRFRDGLSFRAIAELLDVPQGSVAGWYSRAVARMREVTP